MSEFTEEHYRRRRRDVFAMAQAEAEVDAVLVSSPVGVRYLTGLREGSRDLLVSEGDALVLASGMFRGLAEEECVATEVQGMEPPFGMAVVAAADERGWRRIGVIGRCTSVAGWQGRISDFGEERLALIGDVVLERRGIKDEVEIELIREAVEIAEEAFEDLISREVGMVVGATEKELALEMEMLMRSSGADDQAFPNGIILASGPNSYVCHHVPGERLVQSGEAILVDWGAVVEGYRSDLTRMIVVGTPPPKIVEMHAVVKEATEAAVAAVRPGVGSHEIDAVAREVIAKAGYGGEDFRHGTGHGIGLEIHECPYFSKDPDHEFNRELKPGMVMTVEPGIYLKGIGGVRLETDVLITEDGCEDLSSLDLDIVVLD